MAKREYPAAPLRVDLVSRKRGLIEVAMRVTIETSEEQLVRMIRRAAYNKSGRCHAGPTTVYIHPDDHAAVRAELNGEAHATDGV